MNKKLLCIAIAGVNANAATHFFNRRQNSMSLSSVGRFFNVPNADSAGASSAAWTSIPAGNERFLFVSIPVSPPMSNKHAATPRCPASE